MMRATCSRLFCLLSLTFVAGLLIAAAPPNPAPPKDPAPPKEAAKRAGPDPTKPRYVKTDDPALLRYAEDRYLNGKVWAESIISYNSHRSYEDAARRELEDYKREAKPEPAVIRYLERKLQKQQEKRKQSRDSLEQLKKDHAEYEKTRRVPVWIVEEYNRIMRRDDKKPSRP